MKINWQFNGYWKMRRLEDKKIRISRKGAKRKAWRLSVLSEAGVRINMGDGRRPGTK